MADFKFNVGDAVRAHGTAVVWQVAGRRSGDGSMAATEYQLVKADLTRIIIAAEGYLKLVGSVGHGSEYEHDFAREGIHQWAKTRAAVSNVTARSVLMKFVHDIERYRLSGFEKEQLVDLLVQAYKAGAEGSDSLSFDALLDKVLSDGKLVIEEDDLDDTVEAVYLVVNGTEA